MSLLNIPDMLVLAGETQNSRAGAGQDAKRNKNEGAHDQRRRNAHH
jgi:hypothetical protein